MRQRIYAVLSRYWATDHGLSIFLVFLVVVVFVLPLMSSSQTVVRFIGDLALSLLLISGAAALSDRGAALTIVRVVAAVALIVRWASWAAPTFISELWREVSLLVSLGSLSLIILARVFRKGPVTSHRVQGAIAVYLLLGLTWAVAYELVEYWHPRAFGGSASVFGGTQRFVYYSFVTLTTIGYGDLVPVHPIARSLAIMEALTGQLYPAILLAHLVSLRAQRVHDD